VQLGLVSEVSGRLIDQEAFVLSNKTVESRRRKEAEEEGWVGEKEREKLCDTNSEATQLIKSRIQLIMGSKIVIIEKHKHVMQYSTL
jgi:hypothetical protein